MTVLSYSSHLLRRRDGRGRDADEVVEAEKAGIFALDDNEVLLGKSDWALL